MVSVYSAWPSEAPTRLIRRAASRSTPLDWHRTSWPLPRLKLLPRPEEARQRFEETLGASALPAAAGAGPFSKASFSAEADGTLHLCRAGAHLTLREHRGTRQLEGTNPSSMVRVLGEFSADPRSGWCEVFAEVQQFARRSDLERSESPRRRHAVRTHSDGRRVSRLFERELRAATDEELLRRITRLERPDGSWAEEAETLTRVRDRAKVHLVRREHDGGPGSARELCCDYPWLIASAYLRARGRITQWAAP